MLVSDVLGLRLSRYHDIDSKIQCELTLSPRVNCQCNVCVVFGHIGLHIYERK